MQWRVAIALGLLLLVAAGCNTPGVGLDARVDVDAVTCDAEVDGGPADAAVDGPALDGAPIDATVPDAVEPDAGCGPCTSPASECLTASCVDGACVETAVADGTACTGMEPSLCVAGSCVVRGCGDGYRETGPDPAREGCDDGNLLDGEACDAACTPTWFMVAVRTSESDLPRSPLPTGAADETGVVLLVWSEYTVDTFDIVGRRYTPAGVPLDAAPLLIAAGVFNGWNADPTVTGLAEGWAVAWTSPDLDGDGAAVALQIVHGDGTVDAPVLVNTTLSFSQKEPTLAYVGTAIVVAWNDDSVAIRWRRFSVAGLPLSPEQTASTPFADHVKPSLAGDVAGFVLAWTELQPMVGDPPLVRARRYDPAGLAIDAMPLLISDVAMDGTALDGVSPTAARLETGDYVIAFTTRVNDARGDVHARVIPAVGALPAGPSIVVAAEPGIGERLPAVAPLADAGFAVPVHVASPITNAIIDVRLFGVDAALPPEAALLAPLLESGGNQVAGALLRTPYGLWVTWGDDNLVPAADTAFAAFLLGVP